VIGKAKKKGRIYATEDLKILQEIEFAEDFLGEAGKGKAA
jgi:hypothetical protein